MGLLKSMRKSTLLERVRKLEAFVIAYKTLTDDVAKRFHSVHERLAALESKDA